MIKNPKIFTGRARDLEDVKNIILKNPKIDRNYIKNGLTNLIKHSVLQISSGSSKKLLMKQKGNNNGRNPQP
jgi:hypothetical protein